MEIKSNGVNKDVQVLKHFKINEDIYILYKDGDVLSLGSIVDNTITTPNPEKMDVIKKIIGNFISSSPSETVNEQNNCVVLNNNIEDVLEEVSVQHIKLSDEQLGNLTHERDLSKVEYKPMYTDKISKKKGHGGLIAAIIILIIIGGLAVAGFMYKDKIKSFVKNIKIPGQSTKEKADDTSKNTNKKENKKSTTNTSDPKKALENAYTTIISNDYDSFLNLMPKTLREYYKAEITPELFNEATKQITDEVGTNIKTEVKVTPKKMDASWIETNQKYIQEIDPSAKLVECYEYTGTVTFRGSLGEKVLTDKDLYETWYCKVNNDWGFIFG